MNLRPATRNDASAFSSLWNTQYVHDPITLERLLYVIFDDPHADPDGTILVTNSNEVFGFVSGVIVGNEGYLKALVFDESSRVNQILPKCFSFK